MARVRRTVSLLCLLLFNLLYNIRIPCSSPPSRTLLPLPISLHADLQQMGSETCLIHLVSQPMNTLEASFWSVATPCVFFALVVAGHGCAYSPSDSRSCAIFSYSTPPSFPSLASSSPSLLSSSPLTFLSFLGGNRDRLFQTVILRKA